ncbi:starch synthase catalytic domain protein, partial [Chlamydia psittaci 08DC60]
FAEYSDYFGL